MNLPLSGIILFDLEAAPDYLLYSNHGPGDDIKEASTARVKLRADSLSSQLS